MNERAYGLQQTENPTFYGIPDIKKQNSNNLGEIIMDSILYYKKRLLSLIGIPQIADTASEVLNLAKVQTKKALGKDISQYLISDIVKRLKEGEEIGYYNDKIIDFDTDSSWVLDENVINHFRKTYGIDNFRSIRITLVIEDKNWGENKRKVIIVNLEGLSKYLKDTYLPHKHHLKIIYSHLDTDYLRYNIYKNVDSGGSEDIYYTSFTTDEELPFVNKIPEELNDEYRNRFYNLSYLLDQLPNFLLSYFQEIKKGKVNIFFLKVLKEMYSSLPHKNSLDLTTSDNNEEDALTREEVDKIIKEKIRDFIIKRAEFVLFKLRDADFTDIKFNKEILLDYDEAELGIDKTEKHKGIRKTSINAEEIIKIDNKTKLGRFDIYILEWCWKYFKQVFKSTDRNMLKRMCGIRIGNGQNKNKEKSDNIGIPDEFFEKMFDLVTLPNAVNQLDLDKYFK